ncbi:Sucrose nonfermenting 4-like protein [Drosera capensis]
MITPNLGNHGSNLTEEELETHTILAWKDSKSHIIRQVDGNGGFYSRPFIHACPYDSLKAVALKILRNKVSMVPIIHSSSPDGSFPQLLHLASLSGISDIRAVLCPFFNNQSVQYGLRLSCFHAIFVSHLAADVSSVPIVDDNHSLVDIYCRSDITSLAKDKAYAQIHLDEMSIHQALQLGNGANSSSGAFNGQRCQMCLPTDTLHKVMERLANPGVRRIVIVEAGTKHVKGIITLSDVFRFLLG